MWIDKVIWWCLGLNSTIKGSDKAITCFVARKLSFTNEKGFETSVTWGFFWYKMGFTNLHMY